MSVCLSWAYHTSLMYLYSYKLFTSQYSSYEHMLLLILLMKILFLKYFTFNYQLHMMANCKCQISAQIVCQLTVELY